MFNQEDHHYMALAIKLAKQGHYTTSPNPRVGCVLVSNVAGKTQIIGQGFHQKAGQGHAEVNALADARLNYPQSIKGATAYVTLEPCSHFGRTPPCAQALIDSRVVRVVSAMVDPNPAVSGRGITMLKEAGIKACLFYPPHSADAERLVYLFEPPDAPTAKKSVDMVGFRANHKTHYTKLTTHRRCKHNS